MSNDRWPKTRLMAWVVDRWECTMFRIRLHTRRR